MDRGSARTDRVPQLNTNVSTPSDVAAGVVCASFMISFTSVFFSRSRSSSVADQSCLRMLPSFQMAVDEHQAAWMKAG